MAQTPVITWRTHKVDRDFEWQVYSFGYQIPQSVLARGICPTRDIATRVAKSMTRRHKAAAKRAA